jgi:DDE superfamily endonuclease
MTFLISVDSTHCQIKEPWNEPSLQWYSHKFNKAGLNNKIAVDLYESKVVWIHGPFPAGKNDISIYRREGGLQSKIPEAKRVIADYKYQCKNNNALSTLRFNTADAKKLREEQELVMRHLIKGSKTLQYLQNIFAMALESIIASLKLFGLLFNMTWIPHRIYLTFE